MSTSQQPDLFIDSAQGTRISLDEYIEMLIRIRAEDPARGAYAVQKFIGGARRHAPAPIIAYMKLRRIEGARGVALPQFWQEVYDGESEKGDPVIRI